MAKRVQAIRDDSPSKRMRLNSLTDLPDELLVQIFNYLPQRDVLKLMYQSSKFQRPGNMRLYRSIILCEKLNDKFFESLANTRGKTIISSWPAIIQFFEMIYTRIRKNQKDKLQFLSYVEEMASYNPLDSGQLDQFRHLTQGDFSHILKLRQYWDVVIESLPKLKSIVLPKIPLSRFSLMNPTTLHSVQKLCIRLDDSPLDPEIRFPSLKNLTINLWMYPNETLSRTAIVNLYQILGGAHLNKRIEELELNASYGCADKEMEHFIRHFPYHDDVSLRGAMKIGFTRGYKYAMSGNFKDLGISASRYYDEASGTFTLEFSPPESTGLNPKDMDDVLQLGTETIVWRDAFKGCSDKNISTDKGILEALQKIRFQGLRKFTISSMIPKANSEVNESDLIVQLLSPSLKSHTLEEIHFRNCSNNPSGYIPPERTATRFSDMLTRDDIINCRSLKKLTFGVNDELNTDNYETFLMGTASKISELTVWKDMDGGVPDLASLVSMNSLTKLSIFDPTSITKICQKILNSKVLKEAAEFDDLDEMDDRFFELSKLLTEYINATNRLEDYGQGTGIDITGDDTQKIFIDEVLYLFKDDILGTGSSYLRKEELVVPRLSTLESFNFMGFILDREDIQSLLKFYRS
jgi:hypothetical protein